jgi:hypothetical protein
MAEKTDVVILKLKIEESAGKKMPEAKKEVEVLAGSIMGLSKANKELRAERNKVDISTEEGRKKVAALNESINKNNQAIKSNSSALEKQRLNVGNYTGALDKLIPGLGATVNGFGAMTKAALLFIATPIGAVIAALGLAIAAVTRYFSSSEEGQNKFAKITRTVSIVVGNLSDKLSDLGKFLISVFEDPGKAVEDFGNLIQSFIVDKIEETIDGVGLVGKSLKLLFKGQFSAAADAAAEGFKKIVDNATPIGLVMQGATKAVDGFNAVLKESADEIAKGQALEDLKAQTDLLERHLIVQRSVLQAKISELRLRSEDKNLDLKDRSAALQEAMKLQDDLSRMETTVARNRFEIKKTENSFSNSTKEDLNEQAELEAKLFQIQKDNADKKKEMFIKDLALQKEQSATDYKERLSAYEAFLAEEHALYLAAKIKRDEVKAQEAEMEKRFNDRILAETKARIAKETKAKKDAAEAEKNIEDLKNEALIGGVALVTKEKSSARLLLNSLFQQDAIKETWANTYAAAVAAYKAMAGIPIVGPVLGGIAAAVVTAFGLSQVARISGISFAQGGNVPRGYRYDNGGYVNVGGRPHTQGGTKFYGEDGTFFEAEKDEGLFILKKNANKEYLSTLNQSHGGKSWGQKSWYAAQGGQIETRAAVQSSRADAATRLLANEIRNMNIIVTVEDINAKAGEVTDTAIKARVV